MLYVKNIFLVANKKHSLRTKKKVAWKEKGNVTCMQIFTSFLSILRLNLCKLIFFFSTAAAMSAKKNYDIHKWHFVYIKLIKYFKQEMVVIWHLRMYTSTMRCWWFVVSIKFYLNYWFFIKFKETKSQPFLFNYSSTHPLIEIEYEPII